MDWNSVGVSIGNGLAVGFGALSTVNLIGLPISYVMNRYVYHSRGMRILLGIVAAMLSIPILLCMLVYQALTGGTGIQKVHYFGYIPILLKY